MARSAQDVLKRLDEVRLLSVLDRYYNVNDISFERAAREAGVTLYEMIEYFRRKKLPIIWTKEDRVEGARKVSLLIKRLAQ